jgi:hypothetical protein
MPAPVRHAKPAFEQPADYVAFLVPMTCGILSI